MQKALLYALVTPNKRFKELQDTNQFTELMAMQEEMKTYPFGDVWNLSLIHILPHGGYDFLHGNGRRGEKKC